MYKIKEIPEKTIGAFEVPKQVQDLIVEYHGKPLDPIAAYALLKKETKGFTEANPQAEEADRLLHELLYPTKAVAKKATPKAKTAIELRKRKLARTASLLKLKLKLKLKLAAQKQSA